MEHRNRITKKEDMITFLFGGKANFSLRSVKTDEFFSYKVKKYHTYYRVYSSHGHYLGRLWRNLHGKVIFFPGEEPEPINVFSSRLPFHWFICHMEDKQVEFWHEGQCGVCARKLTDPESIKRGIGPECAKKNFKVKENF